MTAMITSNAAFGRSTSAVDRNAFAEMSSGDFMKILLTELTNQDPLEPNDTQATMEQISTLRNIESQVALQSQLAAMVAQNSITQASAMIGKVVDGLGDSNEAVSGLVTKVRVVEGRAVLELDSGQKLALDRVTQIQAV